MRLFLCVILAPALAHRAGPGFEARTKHAQEELAQVKKGIHIALKGHPEELQRIELLLDKASKAAQRAGEEKGWVEPQESEEQPDLAFQAAETAAEDPATPSRDRAIVAETQEARRSLGDAFDGKDDEEELDGSSESEGEVETEAGHSLDEDLGKLERAFSKVQATERNLRAGRADEVPAQRLPAQRPEPEHEQAPQTFSWPPAHESRQDGDAGRHEQARGHRQPHREENSDRESRGTTTVTKSAPAHRYPSMHQVFYNGNVQLAEHSARLLAHLGQLRDEVSEVLRRGDEEDMRAVRLVRGYLHQAQGVVRDLALFHTQMAREAKAQQVPTHMRRRVQWSRAEDEVRSDLQKAHQAANEWERALDRAEREAKLEETNAP